MKVPKLTKKAQDIVNQIMSADAVDIDHGSIGEILYLAPAAMLCYWNMVEPHDEQMHRKLMLMPLLFATYENYVKSSKSFQEGWNWMEDLNICQKPTKYGQSMFYEAVKNDLVNSKETSFNNTISTISLLTTDT